MADLFATSEIETYLKSVLGSPVRILKQSVLAKPGKKDVKGYGYGTPILIEYEAGGVQRRSVLHTVRPGPFGHEHMADRAHDLLWEHSAFNTLPRHVRSMDVGAFTVGGSAVSLGEAEEFFTITEYGEGNPYAGDLEHIRESGQLTDTDINRANVLCDYLVEIHSVRNDNAGLYVRRIRELVGHSECIMGLIDSYPEEAGARFGPTLQAIERQCIEWRWKLKPRVERLRQVHGDFHPWNILFSGETEFCLLDRSRGEWGDPADDVTCLTINYLFFSLQQSGQLAGPLKKLFLQFWTRYLAQSRDTELLQVAAPFLVFRSLVLANPVWYPQLSEDNRQKLFRFMDSVLKTDTFNPERIHEYCGI